MVTSSVEIGLAQAPLLIVQRNTFGPTPKPVTPLVGEDGVVIEPLPLIKVHAPVLGAVGVLPASEVLVVGVQSDWSGPAFAVTAFTSNTVMVIWSDVGAPQGPLLMVHRRTTVPMPRPVTDVVGLAGFVIVPVPLMSDQVPVLGAVGVFPARMAVDALLQML